MYRLLLTLFITAPAIANASCEIELGSIQETVEEHFSSILDMNPYFIHQSEFESVRAKTENLENKIYSCYEVYRDKELKEFDMSRLGEVSDIYIRHHSEIQFINIQLDTAIASFDPIWKRLFIDKLMWKRVVQNYLEGEI